MFTDEMERRLLRGPGMVSPLESWWVEVVEVGDRVRSNLAASDTVTGAHCVSSHPSPGLSEVLRQTCPAGGPAGHKGGIFGVEICDIEDFDSRFTGFLLKVPPGHEVVNITDRHRGGSVAVMRTCVSFQDMKGPGLAASRGSRALRGPKSLSEQMLR
ncbi:unnamed protein product [Lota lota]